MQNIKLVELFSTFSVNEWVSFCNFVKSRDVVSSRKLFPLAKEFSLLFAGKNRFEKVGIISLFEKAYGKGPFKYQTVKNRQSELLKTAGIFLQQQTLEKDYFTNELNLADNLYIRGLTKNYTGLLDSIGKKLFENRFDEKMYPKLDRFYLLNAARYQSLKKTEAGFNNYYEHSNVFMAYALSGIFRDGFEYLMQKSYNITYNFNPVFEFLNSFNDESFFKKLEEQKNDFFLLPLIRFYLYKSIQSVHGAVYFAKSGKLYFKNEKKFTDAFKTEVYRMFMSYYLIKINAGEKKYYANLFRLYQKKLKQGLVSDISLCTYPANVFREYVIIALKLERFEWAKKFVNKYFHILPENIRDDELSLAKIRILFAEKEFGNILNFIEKTRSNNYLHHLDTSRFKLMSYYEMSRFEESFLEIDRMKHYIRKNKKIPKLDLNLYVDFMERLAGLLKIKLDPDKRNKDFFLNELRNLKKFTPSKEWIVEKAKEL